MDGYDQKSPKQPLMLGCLSNGDFWPSGVPSNPVVAGAANDISAPKSGPKISDFDIEMHCSIFDNLAS